MASTSLQLISSDPTAKTSTLSITNVEPTSTSAQAVQFTQKLNALTKNSYVRTDRVDKINCDTEPVPGGVKPTPTLTLSHYTATAAQIKAASVTDTIREVYVTTNSNGSLYVECDTFVDEGQGILNALQYSFGSKGGNKFILLSYVSTAPNPVPTTFKIGVSETDDYSAAEATFTVTAS